MNSLPFVSLWHTYIQYNAIVYPKTKSNVYVDTGYGVGIKAPASLFVIGIQ